VQFGDVSVTSSFFNSTNADSISRIIYDIRALPIDDVEKQKKIDETAQLARLAKAYAMGGVKSVSEDYHIQLITCFNDTELEIRARAFCAYINNKTKEDSEYPSITGSTLKSQIKADESTKLMNEFLDWYDNASKEILMYRTLLEKVFVDYKEPRHGEFHGKIIESLTPAQIIELDKKLRDKDYPLDLNAVP
jgi:hypothetical protein